MPHPLIQSAFLYVADVPGRVKWSHLEEVFSQCGRVRSGGRSSVTNSRKKWTIIFTNVFEGDKLDPRFVNTMYTDSLWAPAEMALATLQGTLLPRVTPPFLLDLSHSPQLDSTAPPDPLFPQYVHSDSADHPLYKASAQDIFRCFRAAGPLVSVRVNIDVGRAHPACVVEYWEEAHANHARASCRTLCMTLAAGSPQFTLRTYDPCNLYCAVRGPVNLSSYLPYLILDKEIGTELQVSGSKKEIREGKICFGPWRGICSHLAQFGQIVECVYSSRAQ